MVKKERKLASLAGAFVTIALGVVLVVLTIQNGLIICNSWMGLEALLGLWLCYGMGIIITYGFCRYDEVV